MENYRVCSRCKMILPIHDMFRVKKKGGYYKRCLNCSGRTKAEITKDMTEILGDIVPVARNPNNSESSNSDEEVIEVQNWNDADNRAVKAMGYNKYMQFVALGLRARTYEEELYDMYNKWD